MRPRVARRFISVLALATAVIGCSETDATAPEVRSLELSPEFSHASGPSAGGHAVIPSLTENVLTSYTFHANTHHDGEVRGQFQLHTQFGEDVVVVHGEVRCLVVDPVSGVAHLGGVITRIRGAQEGFFNVGDGAIWSVRDNGEGADDLADLASPIVLGWPLAELCVPFAFLEPSQRANIQVKP